MSPARRLAALLPLTLAACSVSGLALDGAVLDADGLDASMPPPDAAGAPLDGGVARVDAGANDTGAIAVDGGAVDAGGFDAGAVDAGVEALDLRAAFGDCGGTFRRPDRYPNQLLPGTDLKKLTLTDADALCNDGTPAVLFVRAATDPTHAADWILHLQGGGGCGGYEECRVRWCGDDYYDASKMSSAFTPPAMRGVGIHDPRAENSFAGWNHAYFYYCSSDSWTERGRAVIVDPTDPSRRVAMERRGHTIVARAFGRLAGGATSDDGSERLPGMASARTVVLSGTSAGSVGAQANLDWARGRFDPAVTRVVGFFDAAISPAEGALSADFDAARLERARASFEARAAAEGIAPFVDESCAAAYASEPWRCQTSLGVHVDHLETPYFVRMDLSDSLAVRNYGELGVAPADYKAAMRATLLGLAARPSPPGVYGPNCGQHVGIESSAWFLQATLADERGAEVSAHDAFRAWLDGRDVALVDEVVRARSRCAAADDAR